LRRPDSSAPGAAGSKPLAEAPPSRARGNRIQRICCKLWTKSGLALAVALTADWDTFIGYEFFRFVEFVL
jgi:hypothetical protein